jgi:uncharacterized protein (TIGR02145 family)
MEEALFEVKNKNGQTVFAVYNEGVRIYVDDGKAKGATKGGFAIGGFSTLKSPGQEYMRVTRDSTRVYVNEDISKGATKGGFAIGGFSTVKAPGKEYLLVTPDSTRIYVNDGIEKGATKGGFAIGGFNTVKGLGQEYLRVTRDSTRIYVNNNIAKGATKGGFAIGGFDQVKGGQDEYLRVTSDSVKVSKSLLIPRLTLFERDHLPFVPGEALIIFNTTEGCMQIFKNKVWSNIWCFNCAPAVIIQPVDNTICSGNNVTIFISASGMNLDYQWQQSTDNGNTWNNMSNGGTNPVISGAKGYTLTLTNVPVVYNSNKYRCVVTGSCPPNVTSNAVTLNVGSTPPIISTQPTNQQLTVGCSASFNIVSPGFGVVYKWQQSSDGGSTWTNIVNGGTNPLFAGATASALSLSNVPLTFNNYKFHCVISNACGSDVTSNAATLAINILPVITVQPVNKLVYSGQTISFNITTSGSGYLYQWQVSTDGSTWNNITNGGTSPTYAGANTVNLTLSNVPLASDSYKYRCVVSHYCRPTLISDAATLTVPPNDPVTDINGNTYNTVGIGSQLWMKENLRTTTYNDGKAIPLVTLYYEWGALGTPAYCWYNNDEASYKATYGALYNWYTVYTGKLCPTGWHVPTDAEWTTLFNYVGGDAGKLKESGTTHWAGPDIGATNESGFTALPGGTRSNMYFTWMQSSAFFYSSTQSNASYAWRYELNSTNNGYQRSDNFSKLFGMSVRCLKGVPNVVLPVLTTTAISSIENLRASSGGNISSDGGALVTERGVCWSTATNPTIADSKTTEGIGGTFTSSITGLSLNTKYYVKAYATNCAGTAYGNEVSFTTTTAVAPTLTTTTAISSITYCSASSGGNVSGDGGAPVTERGVCWSTVSNPTIADSRSSDGAGLGTFTSPITNLNQNIKYYVRAYATNYAGTSYANEINFTTSPAVGTVTDLEGNVYNTVKIGTQTWMSENLKATKYNNGTDIPLVEDNTAWYNLATPGYCWIYNNEATFKNAYGALYNWYTVDAGSTGGKNVCPIGWHVPSYGEWTIMTDYQGGSGYSFPGGKLKETGTTHWVSPNTGATNESGFTGFSGWRFNDEGASFSYGNMAYWWISTEYDTSNAWMSVLWGNSGDGGYGYIDKRFGYPVRCVKDSGK